MDTAGESPVKRVKKTHRGRRSSAGQKKRDQRNEKYYLGAFAFEWLAQNYGTASCNVASTSDGGVRSIETDRDRTTTQATSVEEECGNQTALHHKTTTTRYNHVYDNPAWVEVSHGWVPVNTHSTPVLGLPWRLWVVRHIETTGRPRHDLRRAQHSRVAQ